MNSAAAAMRSARSMPVANALSLALRAALVLLIAWQCWCMLGAATSRNVMFDGAMNLGEARSLAEGAGPRQLYDARDLFPAGVQTREPVVLPAAAVFAAFGVGPLQAQATNLAYYLLFVVLTWAVLRRVSDGVASLVAVVLALSTPEMTLYGLGGYGEIPTFFFGFAALALIASPCEFRRHVVRRCILAGILAGLAVATKTIGLVQPVVVGCVLVARTLVETKDRWRALPLLTGAFVFGVAVPLLTIECWRRAWLGPDGYQQWWQFQFASILSQSGVGQPTPAGQLPAKIAQHYEILAAELSLTQTALSVLLVATLAGIAVAFGALSEKARRRCRWLLLGLLLLVGLYFPWWLAVVPTPKAWLRYLYIGWLAITLLAGVGLTLNARAALRPTHPRQRLLHAAFAAVTLVCFWPFVQRMVAVTPVFGPNEEAQATQYAARQIAGLSPDSQVFGYGWYAAPVIQLYAGRGFMDLTDWPMGLLDGHPVYVVADRATLMTGALDKLLARYPHRRLLRRNTFAQVYELDVAHASDPFEAMDATAARAQVDFLGDTYPLTWGVEPDASTGGRFVESDTEILLRYAGEPLLDMTAYMGLQRYYLRPELLRGRIVLPGCPPMPFSFQQPGWTDFSFPLRCRPPAGNVRVRLLLDNVFDLPFVYDHQRAMLVQRIGFSDKADAAGN